MKKTLFEWLWRLAVLCALGWIGLQLQRLHEDITAPVDDSASVAAAPDEDGVEDDLDAIRDELDGLTRKVDAIMVAMARGGR